MNSWYFDHRYVGMLANTRVTIIFLEAVRCSFANHCRPHRQIIFTGITESLLSSNRWIPWGILHWPPSNATVSVHYLCTNGFIKFQKCAKVFFDKDLYYISMDILVRSTTRTRFDSFDATISFRICWNCWLAGWLASNSVLESIYIEYEMWLLCLSFIRKVALTVRSRKLCKTGLCL